MALDVTDAWHPTVNPSARMPVHHHRHLAVLGHADGLLNEFPRHRGGTTIRLPRIWGGRLHVVELPGQSVFAPWWLPASDPTAVRLVDAVYDAALLHAEPSAPERGALARLRDGFRLRCAQGRLTIGEALWQAADVLHRELVPSLPALTLISLTRSPVRHTLAEALAQLPGGLLPVLARWAEREGRHMWPLLAVATSTQGVPVRIRLHARSRRLDISPLPTFESASVSGRPVLIGGEELIDLLDTGRLIPGSRLTALAETSLHLGGTTVRHFGNTYGNFDTLSTLLPASDTGRIPACADDEDSWHYADLPDGGTSRYPLHLIELAACSTDTHAAAEALIDASVARGAPVRMELKGDLDATVRGGRARLLR
ncbi:hypothetical protein AB0J21_06390 [Streptomyces sp. NPDC049954]|uniref:hypothetical protein n=1 Tax=Streptomyces sp. NPDC049954 TaxID=3155779 RepID=UPI0034343DBA